MFKHVLVATDGSERAKKAVNGAISFSKLIGARVTAYYAVDWRGVSLSHDESFGVDSAALEKLSKNAFRRGEAVVTEAANLAQAAGVKCDAYVTETSSAAQGIIDAAKNKDADVIFIASHGRGDVASLLLGSVTQKVLANSNTPVLVYR